MKLRPLILICSLLPLVAVAQQPQLMKLTSPQMSTQTSGPVRVYKFVLDEMHPVPIPTNPLVTTTISFPSPIGGVDAVGYTADPNNNPNNIADFLIEYNPGNSYLSIAPLKPTSARNLNVYYNGRVYCFEPFPVSAELAATTIIMTTSVGGESFNSPNMADNNAPGNPGNAPGPDMMQSADNTPGGGGPGSVIKTRTLPPRPVKTASSMRILGVIDTLKTLSIFNRDELQDALNVMPNMILSVRDGSGGDVSDNGPYTITILKVLRQNKLDVLAFEVGIKNTTDKPVLLDPESFTVRRGDKVYYAVTADFDGDLAPHEKKIAYFAIIGTPEGMPNWLAPNNQFSITLDTLNKRRGPVSPLAFPDEIRQLEDPKISDTPYIPHPMAGSAPAPTPRPNLSQLTPPIAPSQPIAQATTAEMQTPGAASLEPQPDQDAGAPTQTNGKKTQ